MFLSYGILIEKDDDGYLLRLLWDCSCKSCKNEFGGYLLCKNVIVIKDLFSLIGYIFIFIEVSMCFWNNLLKLFMYEFIIYLIVLLSLLYLWNFMFCNFRMKFFNIVWSFVKNRKILLIKV